MNIVREFEDFVSRLPKKPVMIRDFFIKNSHILNEIIDECEKSKAYERGYAEREKFLMLFGLEILTALFVIIREIEGENPIKKLWYLKVHLPLLGEQVCG